MHRALAIALGITGIAGCRGILGIDDPVVGGSQPDAMTHDTGPGSDTPPAGPTCLDKWRDGTVQLTAPSAIMDITLAKQQLAPWLSDDELELWFIGIVTPTRLGVFRATRANTTAMFTNPQERTDLDAGADTFDISLSGDTLTATVARDDNNTDILLATRTTATGTFSAPSNALVSAVNSGNGEVDGHLSADGLRLYISRVPSSGPAQIMVATRASTTVAFGAPTAFSLGGSDSTPGLSHDETVMIFSRDIDAGTFNLYYTTRATMTAPFGTAVPVPITASTGDDGPFLSADSCTLYFRRNLGDGSVPILATHVIL